MAYCTRCGTASNGAFCAQCGAPIPKPGAPTPPRAQPGGYSPAPHAHQAPYYSPPPKRSNGWLLGLGIVGGVVAVGLVAIIGLGALDSTSGGPSPASGASSGSSAPAPSTKAKAGYVTGRILDERGAPLKVGGDQAVIRVNGQRTSDMSSVTGLIPVQSDGTFEMKISDGQYKVVGFVKTNYAGKEYWLTLDPSTGPNALSSKAGIAVDMRLKLSGLRPGYDAANPYSYYGGFVTMQYQGRTLPDDAQVKFTVTPVGPLADGAQGQPRTFTATGKQLRSNPSFKDIPLGKYRITGEVTLSGGAKKTALISLATGAAAPSQEFTFPPASNAEGVEGVAMWMMGEQ